MKYIFVIFCVVTATLSAQLDQEEIEYSYQSSDSLHFSIFFNNDIPIGTKDLKIYQDSVIYYSRGEYFIVPFDEIDKIMYRKKNYAPIVLASLGFAIGAGVSLVQYNYTGNFTGGAVLTIVATGLGGLLGRAFDDWQRFDLEKHKSSLSFYPSMQINGNVGVGIKIRF